MKGYNVRITNEEAGFEEVHGVYVAHDAETAITYAQADFIKETAEKFDNPKSIKIQGSELLLDGATIFTFVAETVS